MGTHLRVLGESFQMNTKTTGFECFFQENCILVLWTKVVSALEGLKQWQGNKFMHDQLTIMQNSDINIFKTITHFSVFSIL